MYKRFVNALYVLNILFQSLYTLALPIGVGALVSYLLTEYTSCPKWIWAVLLMLGVFCGLFSMIKFLLTSIKNFELLEKQREMTKAEAEEKASRQAELRALYKSEENKGE